MAKKQVENPRVYVEWTSEGPVATITNFVHLTPNKINVCFEAAIREWNRLRAAAITERRRQEMAEVQEQAGAENG